MSETRTAVRALYWMKGKLNMARPTQILRDAAILVALILLATSVRVTALPESPIEGPQAQAAAPASVPAALPATVVPRPASTVDIDGDTECRELSRLTVLGEEPGEVVVIEVEIDPRLRSALGLCPATNGDPRTVPADKA